MAKTLQFEAAKKSAIDVWGIEPVQNIRMPMLENQRNVITAEVDALWTDRGLRPNAKNLAFLMQSIANDDLEQWKQRVKTLPVRASLFVSSTSTDLYLVQSSSSNVETLETQHLNLNTWQDLLVSPKSHLFKPKELAKLKFGQLSLADLEEEVTE